MSSNKVVFKNESDFREWLNTYDPNDQSPGDLASNFVSGINTLGMDVYRSSLWLPTSHPELWGTQVVWTQESGVEVFQRDHLITSTPIYLNTPGEAVHKSRKPLRWKLTGDNKLPYSLLNDIKIEGGTDYLIVPFHTDHEREQPWITFTTKRENGFSDKNIKTLIELCAPLSWKARVIMSEIATRSLLSVYLGDNAAQRVLKGQFKRGTGEKINAIIWFCDLRGFTALGDALNAEDLVHILDQYFECIADPIEKSGGEILKFIGDAILAIFPLNEPPQKACSEALIAARQALENLKNWSSQKTDKDRPVLEAGISLHIGEVLYGNIGGSSRLDFTVIGSAVNEASRVESLCKSTYPLLTTKEFEKYVNKGELVSIGIKELRGVHKKHEIFTLAKYVSKSI